jgi:hypothetical protein
METVITKKCFDEKLKEIGFDRTKFSWVQYPKENYDEITICKIKMVTNDGITRAVKDGEPQTFLVEK